MTPMFAVSPLSPDRARHKRINGTRIIRSDVTELVSDDHLLPDRFARHQSGPEGDDFRRFRAPLIRDVRDPRHCAEHPRHHLRGEARVDLALVLIAHGELYEHLARLAGREGRMTRVPADELVQRLLVRALSAGSVPERLGHFIRFREGLRTCYREPSERAPTGVITD